MTELKLEKKLNVLIFYEKGKSSRKRENKSVRDWACIS